MKKILVILISLIAFSFAVKSQTVNVYWQDNNGPYTGSYTVRLYVYDNIAGGNPILVGEKINQNGNPIYFSSSEINLEPVTIIPDEDDRYRYIAYIVRESGFAYNGYGSTGLLDSGEVTSGNHIINIKF